MAALRTFGLYLPASKLPTNQRSDAGVGNCGAPSVHRAKVLWHWAHDHLAPVVPRLAVPDGGGRALVAFCSTRSTGGAKDRHQRQPFSATGGWSAVLRSPLFWAIVPLPCLTNAIGPPLQGLWAGPWLVDVAKLPANAIGGDLLFDLRRHAGGQYRAQQRAMGRLMQRGISPVIFCFVARLFAGIGRGPFCARG